MDSKLKYGYRDVSIVPEVTSTIESGVDCDYLDAMGMLPIFTSPTSSVVGFENAFTYYHNRIYPIIPKTCGLEPREHALVTYARAHFSFLRLDFDFIPFIAFSLSEAIKIFLDMECGYEQLYEELLTDGSTVRICIDGEYGNSKFLLDTIKVIKSKWGSKVIVMGGVIGNPLTYYEYEAAGCDYVRCGSADTGVHYPNFSLIKEVYEIKERIEGKCRIIADGGIKGYDDIQKALIYADYVMIGELFDRAIESSGETTYGKFYWYVFGKRILNPFKTLLKYGKKIDVTNFRVAKEVMNQVRQGKLDVWKEVHGTDTRQMVEYSLEEWVRGENESLMTAMMQQDAKSLSDYKNAHWVRVTNNG